MRSHKNFSYKRRCHFNKKDDSRQLIDCKTKNCCCQNVGNREKNELDEKKFRKSSQTLSVDVSVKKIRWRNIICLFWRSKQISMKEKTKSCQKRYELLEIHCTSIWWDLEPFHNRCEIEDIIFKQISKYFLKNFPTKRQRNFLFRTFFEETNSFKHSTYQPVLVYRDKKYTMVHLRLRLERKSRFIKIDRKWFWRRDQKWMFSDFVTLIEEQSPEEQEIQLDLVEKECE
jgi:hypothetical protein